MTADMLCLMYLCNQRTGAKPRRVKLMKCNISVQQNALRDSKEEWRICIRKYDCVIMFWSMFEAIFSIFIEEKNFISSNPPPPPLPNHHHVWSVFVYQRICSRVVHGRMSTSLWAAAQVTFGMTRKEGSCKWRCSSCKRLSPIRL